MSPGPELEVENAVVALQEQVIDATFTAQGVFAFRLNVNGPKECGRESRFIWLV